MIESLTIEEDGAVIYRKPIMVDGVVTEYDDCYLAPGAKKPKEVQDAIKAMEATVEVAAATE